VEQEYTGAYAVTAWPLCLFVAEPQSVEAEAADGVFADAAEVERVVVLDDV
jgi:putative methionine-R-sulfoxide reductase with GAF domain